MAHLMLNLHEGILTGTPDATRTAASTNTTLLFTTHVASPHTLAFERSVPEPDTDRDEDEDIDRLPRDVEATERFEMHDIHPGGGWS